MNKKVKIILCIIGIMLCPIVVGIIVSIPSLKGLPTADNEWIGFWGNYAGGLVGAAIGGFVAYLIAKKGFDNQRIADNNAHMNQFRVDNLLKLNSTVITLKQKVELQNSYIFSAQDYINQSYTAYSTGISSIDQIKEAYKEYRNQINDNGKLILRANADIELHFEICKPFYNDLSYKIEVCQKNALHVFHQANAVSGKIETLLLNNLWIDNAVQMKIETAQIKLLYEKLIEMHDVSRSDTSTLIQLISSKIVSEFELKKEAVG